MPPPKNNVGEKLFGTNHCFFCSLYLPICPLQSSVKKLKTNKKSLKHSFCFVFPSVSPHATADCTGKPCEFRSTDNRFSCSYLDKYICSFYKYILQIYKYTDRELIPPFRYISEDVHCSLQIEIGNLTCLQSCYLPGIRSS